MFDLTSSKLFILGIVALIVVGPKELPFLLRTVGKYVAMIRRQANEFRAQFDQAMREAELDTIKKDLEQVARDTQNTIRDTHAAVQRDVNEAVHDVDQSLRDRPPGVVDTGATTLADSSSQPSQLSAPSNESVSGQPPLSDGPDHLSNHDPAPLHGSDASIPATLPPTLVKSGG